MKLKFKKAFEAMDAAKSAAEPTSQHRILIVDDEAPNLDSLRDILGSTYPVTTCLRAGEALEKIAAGEEYSVVISDYMMPEMSGVEFFKELRQRQHSAPRIMVTGFAALDNVIAAINDGGVYQYVTKPVRPEQLEWVVKEAVALREMKDENGRLLSLVKELLERNSELLKDVQSLGGDVSKVTEAKPLERPRRVQLSVLMVDVRGFSKAVENTSAEGVVGVLQQIFKPIHDIVYESGGIIDKHLGDGVMAIFGLSGTTTTGVAMASAEKIAKAVSATLRTLPSQYEDLKVSFGLAGGEVVLGMLGSEHRSELAVIGRPANLAARLQEFTKVALNEPGGEDLFGSFDRVMGLIDASLFEGYDLEIERIKLTDAFAIRDFEEVREVGVIRA